MLESQLYYCPYQAVEKRRRGSQCNTDGGPAKTAEKA
ncbi:Uncharacterised protein [Ectopseudomonas oleovorans]|uniref:Uncharacterized protein n=1 Tax=Ectopseudomonas oleovorans TaxID=301 RepID=A0A379K373_ECTOL|nr:Uncharacterised protein [Pseudomonas oleovorans]